MSRIRTGLTPDDWRDVGPSAPAIHRGHTGSMVASGPGRCQSRSGAKGRCALVIGHAGRHIAPAEHHRLVSPETTR